MTFFALEQFHQVMDVFKGDQSSLSKILLHQLLNTQSGLKLLKISRMKVAQLVLAMRAVDQKLGAGEAVILKTDDLALGAHFWFSIGSDRTFGWEI